MSSVILYDIDRQGHRACWSPNVWKVRFVLNFKQLDYETRWLKFPEIAPTLARLGISPNTDGGYTCPAIQTGAPDAHGTALMDSLPIVKMLEEMQPETPLHLDAPELTEVEALMWPLMRYIGPIALPIAQGTVFTPACADYKEKTLIDHFGMGFDQLAKEKGGEGAWTMLQEPLKEMAALLKKNDGPFILGHKVSYADFVIAGYLQSGKRIGDGEMYRRIVGMDPVFEKIVAATEKWATRDDH